MAESYHPFLEWCSSLMSMDAARQEGHDIILTELGGKRFGLGIHDGKPLLCWLSQDASALESIRWTSAAFAYALKGSDWVALSALDVRVPNSGEMSPVKMRLFVPVTVGRLDAWKKSEPKELAVGAMTIKKGVPSFDGTPFRKLGLKILSK